MRLHRGLWRHWSFPFGHPCLALHISICHFAGRADRRRHRKNRRRSNRLRAGEATHRSFYSRRRTDRRPWASLLFQCGHTSGRSTLNRVRLLHSFGDGNTCSHYRFKSFIPGVGIVRRAEATLRVALDRAQRNSGVNGSAAAPRACGPRGSLLKSRVLP